MDLKSLVLKIGGDSSGAESALNKIGGLVKTVLAGAAVAATVKWIDTTIKLGIEAERAGALLGSTMKTTLGATEKQIAAAQKWAEEQEKVNHFDAELLMGQLDKAIVKYGDMNTAELAVAAAQEVARLKGIDVAAAYELVQGASNGMARSLKQFGIEAKAGTTQTEYLQQILEKTNGSTEAYNKTTAGMTEAMKLSYEVMRETLGQALLPIVNTLMKELSPIIVKMTDYIIKNMPEIQRIIGIVCTAIGTAFRIAGAIIGGVVDAIKWIIEHAKEAVDWIKGVDANAGVNQGMGIAVGTPHASGGWVGLNGPEVALVGERGPEYITPAGGSMGGDRAVLDRLDALINAVTRVAPGVASAVNGLGRGV